MKKLMWIVCLLVVSVTAQAQFEKGKWIVNPSVTGLGLSYSKSEKTQFGLQAQGGAEAGYAFFLTRTVTIEPAVYYDLSFKDSDLSKFGLKVGFGFYF